MSLRRSSTWITSLVMVGIAFVGFRFASGQDGKALSQKFKELDKDGNNALDSDELRDQVIFEKLDADADGSVTLEEARKAFASGVLTREEVEGKAAPAPVPDPISTSKASVERSTASIRQGATVLRPSEHGVGRFVPDIVFADIFGKQNSLKVSDKEQFVVVAMTSTSCPLSRKYLPTLAELVKQYSSSGVRFVAVNCVPTDKSDDMIAAAKILGDAVYVHDSEEVLSQHVGAKTTTDVVVLDRARTVVYHGAIDDQYGIGYALDSPRRRFLALALDSLLAGTQPEIAATAAPGCVLEHDREVAKVDVTYHNRISRIVQQNCIECHRSGGVGPFSLETYADVVGHAPMLRQVVEQKTMPPWFAATPEGQHGSVWANDRSLSESDLSDLVAWLKSDRVKGNPQESPLPRTFPIDWSLGTPDYVVQIPRPIRIKATGTMPYQFETAETTLTEDKWIQGYEILPTDRSVVHHVLVNVHEKGTKNIRDREEGIGGYWAAYVPGNAGQIYPKGFARKLPAGATISFQIHYTPSGEATQDQVKLGLFFADGEPEYVISTIPLADPDLNIPPHAAEHVESITRPVPVDVRVLGYMAHMHVRGKAFQYELLKADGTTESLLNIPNYDFNWQLRYDYRDPKVLPAGSRVKVTAVFDNSEGNPANPDPTKTVHWGPQTFDEMLIGYVETYAPVGEQLPSLRSAGGGTMFTLLDSDGDDKLSREEARRVTDRVPALKGNPERLDGLFQRFDADQDDRLSREEFDQLRQEFGGRRQRP